jgi:hypothetical protein
MVRLPDLDEHEGWSAHTYCQEAAAAATALVDDVNVSELGGRTGWAAQLKAYRWRGKDWVWRINKAEELHAAFERAHDAKAIEGVLKFGGMWTRGCAVTPWTVRGGDALAGVDAGDWSSWSSIPGTRIASVSKVYAAADPTRWTIYDSRVAAALTHLVRRHWNAVGGEDHPGLLRFPVPPHRPIRGERLPAEGFKKHYPSPTRAPHARLAFVYASWLSRCMLVRLNEVEAPPDPIGSWQPLHIEMALFTLGEDTRIFG